MFEVIWERVVSGLGVEKVGWRSCKIGWVKVEVSWRGGSESGGRC